MTNRTLLLAALAFTSTSAIAGDKVSVCHAGHDGAVLMLNISVNAEAAHFGHGDWAPVTWYADDDGDGFGDAGVSAESCDQPDGFVGNANDVDDTDPLITDSNVPPLDYCTATDSCEDDAPTDSDDEEL